MKIKWNLNSIGDGVWAKLESNDSILMCVYRRSVANKYVQMVWIEGSNSRYSESEHNCCFSAMVHAEAAAAELADELALQSAVWQEV